MELTANGILKALRGFLLVSCLTFLQTATALQPAPVAQICTEFKNIGVAFINIEPNIVNCDSFKAFDEIISSMQAYSESPLYLGYLQIDPRNGNNYGSENFDLSKVTISYDEYGIDWNRATKIIFIHEIGHLILDNHLAKEIPLLRTLTELRSKQAAYTKMAFKFYQRKGSAILPPLDASGLTPTAALQKFRQERRAELAKLAAIRSGYDELYADLVQALVLKHPAINNQASRLFRIPTESCRTFNEDLPAGFVGGDDQCRLSNIRYQLWNEFVVPNLSNRKLILAKLARVIRQEVAIQMLGRIYSPTEQGDRLIQALQSL